MGFYLDPIEQQSGGSLPPTSGFHASPVEQRSGGSLPPTRGGFQLDPIEQPSNGSVLAPSRGVWGRSIPTTTAPDGMSSIYDMFFGGD